LEQCRLLAYGDASSSRHAELVSASHHIFCPSCRTCFGISRTPACHAELVSASCSKTLKQVQGDNKEDETLKQVQGDNKEDETLKQVQGDRLWLCVYVPLPVMLNLFQHLITSSACHAELVSASCSKTLNQVQGDNKEDETLKHVQGDGKEDETLKQVQGDRLWLCVYVPLPVMLNLFQHLITSSARHAERVSVSCSKTLNQVQGDNKEDETPKQVQGDRLCFL
jgi:hypothetical protein